MANDIARDLQTHINRLRTERETFIKEVDAKIASLEAAYETLTGRKFGRAPATAPKSNGNGHSGRGRGRGLRIDRHAGQKTYEFLKSRGDQPTTASEISKHFKITPEAASQRILNLYNAGKAVRVETGRYVAADQVQAKP